MNTVSLVGNLTRDPAYFDGDNGKIAKFDIARWFYQCQTL